MYACTRAYCGQMFSLITRDWASAADKHKASLDALLCVYLLIDCNDSTLHIKRMCMECIGQRVIYNFYFTFSRTAAQVIHLESRARTIAMCIARATPALGWSA